MKKFLSSKPLHIAQLLTTRIQKGEWTTALPSERVLSEEYLVNRTSILSALDILEEKTSFRHRRALEARHPHLQQHRHPKCHPRKRHRLGLLRWRKNLAHQTPHPPRPQPLLRPHRWPPRHLLRGLHLPPRGEHRQQIIFEKAHLRPLPKPPKKLDQAPSLEVHLPLRSQDLQLDREIGSCQSGTLFTNLQNAD